MSRLQSFVDRVLRAEVIKGTADQYMKCWWLLALPGERRVYLHKFVGSDWSRDLHDHPKWFVSIGLWGGYVEEYARVKRLNLGRYSFRFRMIKARRRWTAPWIRFFPATHIHRLRVNRKRPCWTIVITGRVSREWGFWSEDKTEDLIVDWIPWHTYITRHGIEE